MALMRYHFTIKAIFQYYIVCSVVGIFLCVVDVDDDIVWRGGLVVGRRTCDLLVAGSRPGRDAAAQQP